MTRVGVLAAGYAAFAVAFAAFAATTYVGVLLTAGLLFAMMGGVLLAFSDDDLPKWAGLAIVGYFALMVVVFLLGTPITIDKGGGYFVNAAPPEFATTVLSYLGFVAPVMLAATALAAAWERERPPRILLGGALAGCVLFALLSLVLIPGGEDIQEASAAAGQQGLLLGALLALAGAAGAIGCGWAAARPQEVA